MKLTELKEPPQTCPNCARACEAATVAPAFDGQKTQIWQFQNGSKVFDPYHHPRPPTKCAPCDRGWVLDAKTNAVFEVPRL